MTTPNIVFIVPYRDRPEQLHFFQRQIQYILEDVDPTTYKIMYVHQKDTRPFNRGALKNIGFMIVKELYPEDYKTITLVFNDVDTIPNRKNYLQYETTPGKVKHFYGFTFTLGGIVSITGEDFEKVNGFPNFWAWGFEDNALQKRVEAKNIEIDRSQFHHLMDSRILHLNESINRVVNRAEYNRYQFNSPEGIQHIKNLKYTIDEETQFAHVTEFSTGIDPDMKSFAVHDLRKTNKPFGNKRGGMSMVMA